MNIVKVLLSKPQKRKQVLKELDALNIKIKAIKQELLALEATVCQETVLVDNEDAKKFNIKFNEACKLAHLLNSKLNSEEVLTLVPQKVVDHYVDIHSWFFNILTGHQVTIDFLMMDERIEARKTNKSVIDKVIEDSKKIKQ